MVIKRSRQSHHRVPKRPSHPRKRQLFQLWQDCQWQVVLTLLTFSLSLGYIGFYKFNRAAGGEPSLTDLLYLTLQLTTLESGAVLGLVSWELEIARLLVPLVTASIAILAVAVILRKQLQIVCLWTLRDHIVIWKG